MKPIFNTMYALCCVFLFGLQYASATDWIIVPGERAGPIKRDSGEQDLINEFGAANVKESAIDVGEGMTEPGTIIFPDDATKTAFILWRDPSKRNSPSSITIRNKGTIWKTNKGITVGTTLKDLENLNGKPFMLLGFGWDYGGTVMHSNGGRLVELGIMTSKGQESRTLILRLDSGTAPVFTSDYETVLGDRDFSSGNPAMQKLNPRVEEMINLFKRD